MVTVGISWNAMASNIIIMEKYSFDYNIHDPEYITISFIQSLIPHSPTEGRYVPVSHWLLSMHSYWEIVHYH